MNQTDQQIESGYNGWTNYETWNVALWLGNDAGSDGYWCEQAGEAKEITEQANRPTYLTPGEHAVRILSGQIEEEVRDASPLREERRMYSDILNANLSEVDWDEIAKSYLEAE